MSGYYSGISGEYGLYSEIYGQAAVSDSAEYNAILQEVKEIKAHCRIMWGE